jgi:gluconolactonase
MRVWFVTIDGIAPALRGGAMAVGGIAPALRGGAMAVAVAAWIAASAGCSGDVDPGEQAQAGSGGAGSAGSAGERAGSGGAGASDSSAGDGAGGRAGGGGMSAGTGGSAGGGGLMDAAVDDDGGGEPHDSGTGPVQEDPCPSSGAFGDPLPPPDSRTATPIEGGFDFLEGPVWVAAQGALFFSDMHMGGSGWPLSTIVRFTPPSDFQDFASDLGSNGIALTLGGDLLVATHDMQTLSIYDATDAQRTTLALTYMGDRFNSPNDLTVRADGTIYFTDPDWQLGGRASETEMTGVYRVPPGGEPQLVDGTLDRPNGIALSPDQQTLYVSSAGADLMAYPVAADGSTGTGSVLASPGGSDGMAVDCAGNLYVTAGSVRVFDPEGGELGSISVAEQPANVAFGGSDRRTLYITARTGLYAIELNVPGYPY